MTSSFVVILCNKLSWCWAHSPISMTQLDIIMVFSTVNAYRICARLCTHLTPAGRGDGTPACVWHVPLGGMHLSGAHLLWVKEARFVFYKAALKQSVAKCFSRNGKQASIPTIFPGLKLHCFVCAHLRAEFDKQDQADFHSLSVQMSQRSQAPSKALGRVQVTFPLAAIYSVPLSQKLLWCSLIQPEHIQLPKKLY